MSNNQVYLLSRNDINTWDKIDEMPIVETAPRSVPLSSFITVPPEGYYKHLISQKSELPAVENVSTINLIKEDIILLDYYLSNFYSQRGLTPPLFAYIEKLKQQAGTTLMPDSFKTPQVKEIAKGILVPQVNFLKAEKEASEEIIDHFYHIFTNEKIWKDGEYCNELFDNICLALYKMTALEQLAPSKKGVLNDISGFVKIYDDNSYAAEVQHIRIWFSNTRSITNGLLEKMEIISPELTNQIFHKLLPYIQKNIISQENLIPDMHMAYTNAYGFVLRFYLQQFNKERAGVKSKKAKFKIKPLSNEIIAFSKELIEKYPEIPLIFEFSQETTYAIPGEATVFPSKPTVSNAIEIKPLETQLENLRVIFKQLSTFIAQMHNRSTESQNNGLQLISIISQALKQIGQALNSIRFKLSHNLCHPPKQNENDPNNYSPYERSMRLGLKDDLRLILLLLHICRATKELIQDNFPIVYENVSKAIQNYIQEFSYHKIGSIIKNNSNQKQIVQILEKLRVLSGDFAEETYQILDKKQKKNQKPVPPTLASAPRLDILELLRIQFEQMINPDSHITTKPGVFSSSLLIREKDLKELEKFINDTKYFQQFIQLKDTINVVCDQSNLFFKEHYLGMNNVSFFPVTTSIPMLLSDYALENYQKPELTGAIFYPLSIYDDAASTALRYLKSRYLYDEIKEESRICLMSISKKISDSTFHPIRRFASIRSLRNSLLQDVIKLIENSPLIEGVNAIRLGVLLQQNQLYSLGYQVDIKSLIAERMNEIFNNELMNILGIIEKHGILVSITTNKLIEMMKYTHEIINSFGLPLISFNNLLSRVLATDTPNSIQSLLLIYIVDHLTSEDLFDYYLLTNPMRLIPKSSKVVSFKSIASGFFGDILQNIFEKTSSFISIENFRELFNYLDEGSIYLMYTQIIPTFNTLYNEFQNVYDSVRNRLQRIKDGPLSLNCFQIYDRFEGAYRYFKDDNEILNLFQIMSEIGNILAIVEMIDNAYLMKSQTTSQIFSFFMEKSFNSKNDNQNNNNSEFFQMFDSGFQETAKYFDSYNVFPTESNVMQPFLHSLLAEFNNCVSKTNIFDETSSNLTDFTSLKGFAANWGVLEFLFCLIESGKDEKNEENEQEQENKGAIDRFGEGVMLCAAAILTITNQCSLYRAYGIGERIAAQFQTDFSVMKYNRVKRFVSAYEFIMSSMKCAISSYQPVLKQMQK